MSKPDQFAYIEQAYGKRFRKGQRVLGLGKPGEVIKGDQYVWIRLDGMKHAIPYHPDDVQSVPQP